MRLAPRSVRAAYAAATAAAVALTVLAAGAATGTARLVGVSAESRDNGQTVLIEATEPVAYSVSRPDARTVLVELRNVSVAGAANRVRATSASLIAGVSLEDGTALDGSGVGRVHLALTSPAAHRVRSTRNTIRVELDRAMPPAASVEAALVEAATAPAEGATTPAEPPVSPLEIPAVPELPAAISVSGLAEAAGTVGIDPMAALQAPQPKAATRLASQATKPVVAANPASFQQQTAAPAINDAMPGAQRPTAEVTEGRKRYTGHPVSLDFQNADLRSVLRTFAEISGLNMVIDPAVQGTVDIVLTEVPWDQALDIILRGNQLGYTVDGTIVRIAPLKVLAAEEDERRKLADAQALSGDLRVRTFALSYAKAQELQPLLTRSALSQRGQIQVDPRTNTLIITDLTDRLTTAENLINILDRPEPQVEVEARVVTTTRDFAREIGIQWGLNGRVDPEIGNTTGLAFPNRGSIGGRTGTLSGPEVSNDPRADPRQRAGSVVNLPVSPANGAIGLALGSVNGAFNLDIALSALERTGKGRVLSTPRLTTQNNVEAEVAQGIQIPIQTVANNTVTVSFKDAVLMLKVTPQITSANTVIMRITVENATPDFGRDVQGIPPIDTQRALTQVQVNDGATTVIGGIFVSRESSNINRVPFVHRIPLLGWLFKRDEIQDESRELLIFITPRILRG
ncbi:MAG TPA: type IV pilus secretin PilQ [Vicinamibacterales bacterium]|jgi:type IV pilus assembly protein PilQ|nr:type IV pilus secretin PilQ [Vicinamibacterales bacterium]